MLKIISKILFPPKCLFVCLLVKQLVKVPAICHSKELAAFLSYELTANNSPLVAHNNYSEFERSHTSMSDTVNENEN